MLIKTWAPICGEAGERKASWKPTAIRSANTPIDTPTITDRNESTGYRADVANARRKQLKSYLRDQKEKPVC